MAKYRTIAYITIIFMEHAAQDFTYGTRHGRRFYLWNTWQKILLMEHMAEDFTPNSKIPTFHVISNSVISVIL